MQVIDDHESRRWPVGQGDKNLGQGLEQAATPERLARQGPARNRRSGQRRHQPGHLAQHVPAERAQSRGSTGSFVPLRISSTIGANAMPVSPP